MGLVTGALKLQQGTIEAADVRGLVGYVPQDLQIDGGLTCHQFLNYCAWLKRLSPRLWADEVRRVLGIVGLVGKASDKVGSLSGGMRRRLAVAQALLGDPGLIVLDEPTNALDPTQRRSLLQTIRGMSETTGVLMSTHLVEDAAAVADDVVILNGGRVAWSGLKPPAGPSAQESSSQKLESLFIQVLHDRDGHVPDHP
nr:ATP-binding cassette domain-containing protein [Serinicoccus hydrothermalis]